MHNYLLIPCDSKVYNLLNAKSGLGLFLREKIFSSFFGATSALLCILLMLPFESFNQVIFQEAETGFTYTGPGSPLTMPRSNASDEKTMYIDTTGGVMSWDLEIPADGEYYLVITYSNDNFGPLDTVSVHVDSLEVASLPFQDTETAIPGGGWNVFVNSPVIPLGILESGTVTLSLSLDFSNNGVEYDLLTISSTAVVPPLAPELVLPIQCAEEVNPSPLLAWALVEAAIGYDVQLATDADFTTIIEQDSNIFGLTFQVTETLDAGADYYWRVRVTTAAGESPWSGQFKFTVAGLLNGEGAPFNISEEEVQLGDTVCVSVRAQGYTNIAAYQYSITFDTSILEFVGIEINAAALAGLSVADHFNLELAAQGVITTIFDDTGGASATLEDGTEIYKICFEAKALGTSDIAFANDPTAILVFDQDLNVFDFMVGDGSITVLPCVNLETVIDTTICVDESIMVGDTIYTEPGVYIDSLMTSLGCDSVVILILSVDTIEFQLPEIVEICSEEMANIEFPDGFEGGISGSGQFSQTIMLVPGGHIITVRNTETGCSEEQALTVQASPLPDIFIAGDTTLCAGTSSTLIASGGETYLWSTGETSNTIMVDSAGVYTVLGTDVNGCIGVAVIELTELPLPDISITGDTSFCAGTSSTLIASGGDTYLWSTGQTSDTIEVDSAGIYTVTGTDINGCFGVAMIELTELSLPNITITGDTSFCAGTNTTLIANGGDSYLWNTGETSDTIVVDSAGIYTVTSTDVNGCVGVAVIELIELSLPTISIVGDTPFCVGTSTTLIASGGDTYLWSTGETSDTIVVDSAGVYTVTGTDVNGCVGLALVEITGLPLPNIAITGDTSLCVGTSTTLIASGGDTYLWSTGETSDTIVVDSAGVYTVTGTDVNGCVGLALIEITELPLPTIAITGDTSLCVGTSTTLIASGGDTYLWSTGETSDTIVVDSAGVYTVTGTDVNGCVGLALIEITELPLPNISITGDTSLCVGTSTTLIASGGDTYLWSTGETSDTIVVDSAGIYTVTGTDVNGCVGLALIEITELPLPTISIVGDTSLCVGTSTTLIASGGDTYLWSTGETSDTIVVDSAGIYSVTGTDINGCVGLALIEITELPLPTISITGDTSLCVGTSTTLIASGGDTYLWSTGETSDTIVVDSAGIYTVTGTDVNGCVGLALIEITELPLPTISIAGDTSLCVGTSTTLIASGGDTYLWSTGETSDTIVVDSAGVYTVTGTDINGCVGLALIEITELPLPTIDITGDTSFCVGTSTTLIASGGDTYLWSTGETSDTIVVDSAGVFTVTGTDINGCVGVAVIELTELPLPTIAIMGDTTFCIGTSTTLIASGGDTYLWSTGETSDTIVVDSAGVFTVTGTDINGCVGVAVIELSELPLPNIAIAGGTSFCIGASTTLIASGGDTYLWSTGETSDSIVVDSAGVYTVTGTDVNGCINIVEIEVVELSLPVIEFSGDTQACGMGLATITASGGVTFAWDNGFDTATIEVGPGTYTVTVTNENGCTNTASITIEADTEAPNFTFCPSSVSGTINFGMTEVVVTWPEPFAEDNCGGDGLIITQSHFSGDAFGLGITTVTYTAVDAAGNMATCSFDVTVEESADLTFFIDTSDYTVLNNIFCVPVRVRSFEAVAGFQFTIVAPDLQLSQIVDIEPLDVITGGNQINGFSFVMVDANTYRVLWIDETGQGITLDDSTAVFNLKMIISGDPGDCAPVGFSNDPLAIEAFQVGIGGVVPTVIGGDICVRNLINIEGDIFRINDEPINEVEVSLFGPEVLVEITNPAGQYSFVDQIAGEDYTILPERDFNHDEGVSIIDLVLILRHIQLFELIENPYLLIAADVNSTMSVTISDIVELQSLLLGNISIFSNNTSWRFIPTDYEFPNPAFPWQEVFPEQVDLIAQQTSIGADFYGVKIGDINLSATGQVINPFVAPTYDPFALSMDDRFFVPGESFEVPIRADQIQDIAGLQLELGFDLNQVELVGVEAGNIPGIDPQQSFGYRYLEEGRLPFVWFQTEAMPDLSEDPVLFTLRFKARAAGQLSEVLYLSLQEGKNIAATQEVLTQRVELHSNALTTDLDVLETNRFAILSCSPNPFMEQTTIRFALPMAESVQFNIYDLSGKLVMADQKFFESGVQQWTLDAAKLGGSGMYTCQVQTAEGVEIIKIICQQ